MKIFKLSNGNLLLWSASWDAKENSIDHVLVSPDDQALFFTTTKKINLSTHTNDFLNLDSRSFKQKFGLDNLHPDLFLELQSGLKKGDYPLGFGSRPSYSHKCPKCGFELECDTIFEITRR